MIIGKDVCYYSRAYHDEIVSEHPETIKAIHAYMETLDADTLGELCVMLKKCSYGYWGNNADFNREIDRLYAWLKATSFPYDNAYAVFDWYMYYSTLWEE